MPEPEPTPDLLLTIEEIRELCTDPLSAAAAENLAMQATSTVRDYCGWRVAGGAEETFTLTARGGRLLYIPSLHVTEVLSVTEDSGAPLQLDVDYEWDDHGVLERIRGSWSRRRRAITVTVKHGYDSCPGGISQAISAAVARGTLVPASGVVSETTLGAQVQFQRGAGGTQANAAFLPHELERFDAHRIPRSR